MVNYSEAAGSRKLAHKIKPLKKIKKTSKNKTKHEYLYKEITKYFLQSSNNNDNNNRC
jgi:hypothetical protein